MENVEERWKQHTCEYLRKRVENRPLYRAMAKYGIDSFQIEVIEEVLSELLNEKERYWINFYDSYHNGYNATRGGDGKAYIDYDLVLTLFREGKNCKEIGKITNHDAGWIAVILKSLGISNVEIKNQGNNSHRKSVAMMDKNTCKILKVFPSIIEAHSFCIGKRGGGGHISAVCTGKRKTAHGYRWKYITDMG